ncbi:unnamed protein product, partial [Amoebophrya sp. A25]|eukprot:GSA25T00020362001.1
MQQGRKRVPQALLDFDASRVVAFGPGDAKQSASKGGMKLKGFAAHRQVWNLDALRPLSFSDWIVSLFYEIEIVPARKTASSARNDVVEAEEPGQKQQLADRIFHWLVLSREEIDYDLFPFDFYTRDEVGRRGSSTTDTEPALGFAWDAQGDLVSIGTVGALSPSQPEEQLTRDTRRNAYS